MPHFFLPFPCKFKIVLQMKKEIIHLYRRTYTLFNIIDEYHHHHRHHHHLLLLIQSGMIVIVWMTFHYLNVHFYNTNIHLYSMFLSFFLFFSFLSFSFSYLFHLILFETLCSIGLYLFVCLSNCLPVVHHHSHSHHQCAGVTITIINSSSSIIISRI